MIRLLLALALLALPLAARANPSTTKSPTQKSRIVQVGGMVPPIAFTMKNTATGHTVTAASFRGKVVLLYFGYTNCPDVCPDTLYKMHKLYQRLGPDADKVVFLFVTVDPKRDTSPVLKKYVALFDPHFIALRGTPNQIFRLTRRYRVVASVHPSPNPEQYRVVHSALIYAFGTHGNARFIIPGLGLNPHPDYQALAHDLKQLTHPQPRSILTWLAKLG